MRARRAALAIVASLGLVSCSEPVAEGSYQLVEYAIEGPTELSAEAQTLTVTNSGQFAHTLVITDSDGTVVGATPLMESGEALEMRIDLEAGHDYSFTCRIVVQIPDGSLVDHYEEGMATTVSVRG